MDDYTRAQRAEARLEDVVETVTHLFGLPRTIQIAADAVEPDDRRAALSALLDQAAADEDSRIWLREWVISAMGEGKL